MRMGELLATAERERVLEYLLRHPSDEINLHEIARKLKISPSLVHKCVSVLRSADFLKKGMLIDNAFVRALRLQFNLKKIKKAGVIEEIRSNFRDAKGIGMYGSWATGSNNENADVDLWVKLQEEPETLQVARARRVLEGKLGVSVDLTLLTDEKLKAMGEKGDAFYFSLYHSILLWGEGI